MIFDKKEYSKLRNSGMMWEFYPEFTGDYKKDMRLKVIGLSGLAGSGKDYIATEYFYKRFGFYNISYAWHIKMDCIAKGLITYEQAFNNPKPENVRRILQLEATEKGRDVYGQDVWVKATFNWIRAMYENWGLYKFVIPDIRFINEVKAVQNYGGPVYRIVSDRETVSDWKPELQKHRSETELSDGDDIFDGVIENFVDTDESYLREQIENIILEL